MKKKTIPNQELDFTDVFFKEVSEDVQNDNLKAFWKKYGTQIVLFVALCLTIAVSFETIKHWRDVMNQEYSNAFASAQALYRSGNIESSVQALEKLSEDGNAIYSDIANIEAINILFEQNKVDEAIVKLEKFIISAHNDKLRNAAIIKLASYKVDTASLDEMIKILAPLSENTSSVWQMEAKELLALSALKANNRTLALNLYNEIAQTTDIYDGLRARAQNMISILNSTGDNK